MNNKGIKRTVKRIFKSILNFVSTLSAIVLILIVGFLIYYFLTSKIYEKNGETYKPFVSLYTIISPSMEPNINVYDVVVNFKVNDAGDIHVGDVITFVSHSSISEGLIVTHRVTGYIFTAEGVAFSTKGDNNGVGDDSYVLEKDVLGKVAFRLPKLGKVQFLLASKAGWFVVILLPALGVIIYDIIKLCKLLFLKEKMRKIKELTDNPVSEEQKNEQKKREEQRKQELMAKYLNKDTK